MQTEVKVTRKYQVTIPTKVRSTLGVKIGDKLAIKTEDGRIILEPPRRVANPVEHLWNLSEKPLNVDAVKLIEDSWAQTHPKNIKDAIALVKEKASV